MSRSLPGSDPVPYHGITTASEPTPPYQTFHAPYCSCGWRGKQWRWYADAEEELAGHLEASGHG